MRRIERRRAAGGHSLAEWAAVGAPAGTVRAGSACAGEVRIARLARVGPAPGIPMPMPMPTPIPDPFSVPISSEVPIRTDETVFTDFTNRLLSDKLAFHRKP